MTDKSKSGPSGVDRKSPKNLREDSREKVILLLVDGEEQFLRSTSKRLEVRGFQVLLADSEEKAITTAQENPIDIALVGDLEQEPGLETLKALKREFPGIEVIILTGNANTKSAFAAGKSDAFDYFEKPCYFEQLSEAITEAFKKKVMNKMKIHEELTKRAVGNY